MIRIYSLFFCLLFSASLRAQQPDLVLPTANSNQMEAMAISHNEKMYASADLDDKIKIWEAATGKLLKTLARKNIYDIAFTPDDKALVITSFSSPEIFTIETGKTVKLGKEEYSEGLDISPDGKWLATGSEKNTYIWNTKTFKVVDSIKSNWNAKLKFSHDSKILALYGSQNIQLWSIEKKVELKVLKGHTHHVTDLQFDKTNSRILTCGWDSTARLWDIKTGALIMTYTGHRNVVWNAKFLPGENKIITASSDSTAQIWEQISGKPLVVLEGHTTWIYRIQISPDQKTFALADRNGVCSIWNTDSMNFNFAFQSGYSTLYYLNYLKNSQQIVTGNYDPILSRWNLVTQKRELVYGIHNERFVSISLSNDEKYLLTTSRDGAVRKIDAATGKIIFYQQAFKGQWATSAVFSPDDQRIAVSGGYVSSILYNTEGVAEVTVNDKSRSYESSTKFSPDGEYLLHNDGFVVQLLRVADNKLLLTIDSVSMFTEERFSASGGYIITGGSKKVKIWSVATRQLIREVRVETDYPKRIEISHDSKYFFCVGGDEGTLNIWETYTGEMVKTISSIYHATFSADQQHLIIVYKNGRVAVTSLDGNTETRSVQLKDPSPATDYYFASEESIMITQAGENIIVRDLANGNTIKKITGNGIAFGKSGKILYVLNDDMMEVYEGPSLKLAYLHIITGKKDFLVQDDRGRYDGTEAARKLLYFVCGNEVIELEQAKDQLWVPDLAERIMKGDSINAKTLGELNICGLSPVVEDVTNNPVEYNFKIISRRGGLGETVLLVNGIEARRYKPEQLKSIAGKYELVIRKEELKSFFITGKENPVTVKAYTADNTVSSRGVILTEDNTKAAAVAPNLYAVMVGVSDYKGNELDLKYAAKDATDISAAVSNAAKKLLNTDGKEHVFMYNLTTAAERYLLPEKNSIKKTMEEIGKKATANDILLIFFAGHGVMAGEGDKNQFYFLAADASSLSTTTAVKDVGISTAELTEWMKPQNIKAQKRILIFDACNSGQAIKDFVKMGNDDQNYLAARTDDKAQQIKAIDKLNEKSGLFILSASASNQSAYEMGRYAQGLLTYSLLKAIKQQPDILEDGKYLNVSRWFNAAEKMVTELSKESGARQEPQIVTNTNFNIGVVDEEVMAKIVLPQEKPLFAASNFQNNDETIADDDLEFSKQVNLQLSDLAARGTDSKIVYVTATNSPDAYSLSGRYTVKGNAVIVTVNIRQNKNIQSKFELIGTKDKLNELAAAVTDKAAGMVK